MTTMITYAIAVTAENATKIDQINRILLGAGYTVPAEAEVAETTKAGKGKADAVKATKETPKEEEITFEQFKAAAKAVKEAHGEEFAMEALKALNVEATGLGRAISKVDKGDYADVMETWSAGPVTGASDDDGFGEDDDLGEESEAEVTVEAVTTALKAMAKTDRDGAKAIMLKHGAKALSEVSKCKPAQLAAMMKELV